MKTEKVWNSREKRYEWRARFEYNRKTFRPAEETKEKLLETISEIKRIEKIERDNKKFKIDRPVPRIVPTMRQIFDEAEADIIRQHQKNIAIRVFNKFCLYFSEDMKANELEKGHLQKYIDRRQTETGIQSKKPIKLGTIYREIYLVTGAARKAVDNYESLKNYVVPLVPSPPKGFKRKSKRDRLVTEKELNAVISELMKEPSGKQTFAAHHARVRLAHQLEFGFWTGLRRKEICGLKFLQYDEDEKALHNVKRYKTGTVTRYFPLARRAFEIVEERRDLQKDTDFIFSSDGKPMESAYETLKEICVKLKIPYGRNVENGWTPHDLRHNFGTAILQNSDIETARELLGHSDIAQTGTYIHTSQDRMREAVRKRDKINYDAELSEIFKAIENGELNELEFIETVKKLF